MKIISYDENYAEEFVYNGIEKDYVSIYEVIEKIKLNASLGECYAGLIDDKPVMFCGIIPISEGVLQAWIYLNVEACEPSHLKDFLTFGKHLLWHSGFRRVQTLCVSDMEKAETLLKHLGFKFEGKLKKFLKNADMGIYALLPNERVR